VSANPTNGFPGPLPQQGSDLPNGLAEQLVSQFDHLAKVEPANYSRLIVEIRGLLLVRLAARVESNEEDLFEAGVFDSIALVQFIVALEEHFGLHLPLEEINAQDFATVSTIAKLLHMHVRGAASPE